MRLKYSKVKCKKSTIAPLGSNWWKSTTGSMVATSGLCSNLPAAPFFVSIRKPSSARTSTQKTSPRQSPVGPSRNLDCTHLRQVAYLAVRDFYPRQNFFRKQDKQNANPFDR